MKKPKLNKVMQILFPDKVKLAEQGLCTDCEKEIKEEDFRDDLSKKEYGISGLCQFCIDEIFEK